MPGLNYEGIHDSLKYFISFHNNFDYLLNLIKKYRYYQNGSNEKSRASK